MITSDWFDSHCHLDMLPAKVISESYHLGINHLIIPAVSVDIKKAENISSLYPNIYFTTGCHPLFLDNLNPNTVFDVMAHTLKNKEKCVGVGEIGLDYYHSPVDKKTQHLFFEKQLEIAESFGCPVNIHLRKGFDDFYSITSNFPNITYIMHMFGGSKEVVNQYLKKFNNMYFSFGGPHIRENSKKPKQVIKSIPFEKILIETDSPDLPPEGFDKPNTPQNLPYIGGKIAPFLNMETEEFRQLTLKNGKEAFKWKTFWKD